MTGANVPDDQSAGDREPRTYRDFMLQVKAKDPERLREVVRRHPVQTARQRAVAQAWEVAVFSPTDETDVADSASASFRARAEGQASGYDFGDPYGFWRGPEYEDPGAAAAERGVEPDELPLPEFLRRRATRPPSRQEQMLIDREAGMSYGEIAAKHNVTVGTVKAAVSRARRARVDIDPPSVH